MPFNDSLIPFRVFVYILSACYFQQIPRDLLHLCRDIADYQRPSGLPEMVRGEDKREQ